MAEPVVLSGSSLNGYLRCARQWELTYVYALKRPPSLRQVVGTAGHYAAEVDLTQKIKSGQDLPLDVVLDAFHDSFAREGADSPERPERKETKPIMLDSGVLAVTKWHSEVAPTVDPIMVEQAVRFRINDIPYNGTVDLVDKQKRVRDWKFVGKKPSSSQDYALNMVGYAIGYRKLTGELETGVILDHIVRTRKPYHFPISSDGPVPDQSIFSFARIVERTYDGISRGSFPPTGLRTGACSWCPFKRECGYYSGPM